MTRQNNFNLIKELAWTDFKLKYYGSVLGMFWTFLKPFLMLIILYIVFTKFLKAGIQDYHLYLLLGIVFWNYFADASKDAMNNMTSKTEILQKSNITPMNIILSSTLNSTATFLINLIIFFLIFFIFKGSLTISALYIIILIILSVLLVIGVSCINSLLFMRFTDFGHIWDVFLQLIFWGTPIVYSATAMPKNYLRFFMMNPIARIIVDARNVILYHFFPEMKQIIITIIIISIIFIIGIFFFKKYARELVERL